MIKTLTTGLALATLFGLSSCAQLSGSTTTGSDAALFAEEIPSEEEAATQAEQEITDQNVDQMFLQMQAEIEGGGSDDF